MSPEVIGAHLIIWLILILLTIPVIHIFKSTCCQSKRKSTISDLKLFHKHLDIKICLYFSLILSYAYVLLAFWHTLFFLGIFKRHWFPLQQWQCKTLGIIPIVCYSSARLLLYLFFMIRTYHTFESTKYRYPGFCINTLIISCIICALLTIIPSVYIQYTWTHFNIFTSGNSQWCEKERATRFRLAAVFYFGSFLDCVYAIICVYLLTSRLLQMIRKHTKILLNEEDTPYVQMRDSHPHSQSNDDDLDNDDDNLSALSSFHSKTATNNRLIVMICKLLILLIFVVISSQATVTVYTFTHEGVFIYYSFDVCINTYCLWLSFGFTKHIYYTYFCGKKCIKCCFPCIKTLAISCRCCKSNNISINQQRQIYNLAKEEINEMIEL